MTQHEHDEIERLRAATIERCAQVAEDYRKNIFGALNIQQEIAAAIRALKDKP